MTPLVTEISVPIVGIILLAVLKRIPNEKLRKAASGMGYKLGRMTTLGLASWKWTKNKWNRWMEPYVIDTIDHVFMGFLDGMIMGLRADNKKNN